jgi:hypothetical protein
MDVILSTDPSPIRTAYNMTGEKIFGDGIYALLSSTKESDIKRSHDFYKAFSPEGKYYTEGVKSAFLEPVSAPIEFTHRDDEFDNTPISASVLRMDLMKSDFHRFFCGYRLLLETKWIDDDMLTDYYNELKAHIKTVMDEGIVYTVLNEGGLGGHISHPYEIDDMRFTDMFELITNLFSGTTEDVTEKVDGMNLFASMDTYGNPIFARNLSHISKSPFMLKDMESGVMWSDRPHISDSFLDGAREVAKIFNSIPNAVDFFNVIDNNGNLAYRKWVNLEIVDPRSENVIVYSGKMIMIHAIKKVVNSPDGTFFDEYPREMEQADKAILGKAVEKVKQGGSNVGMSPNVILKKYQNAVDEAIPFIDEIMDVISEYDIKQTDTIGDYRYAVILDYIFTHAPYYEMDEYTKKELARRWTWGKGPILTWFRKMVTPEIYNEIKDFENSKLKQLKKKVIAPFETIFGKIGNKVIKDVNGIINSDNTELVSNAIKKKLLSVIDDIEKGGTESEKDNLEQLLVKLNSLDNIINATEGIVFSYNGSLLKLTGSFAVLNRILSLRSKNSR